MSYNETMLNAHPQWKQHIDRWKFLIDSYQGGYEYKQGNYLTAYIYENKEAYEQRLDNAPLDNHVKAITAIYNSFLFRQAPMRNFGSIGNDNSLNSFFEDTDLDGRDFNSVMRDVSTYSTIYGNCWVIVDKPETVSYTRADELDQGVRPYLSIYTPENVIDWQYQRASNGAYFLSYLKVYEGGDSDGDTFRIYTPDIIQIVRMQEKETVILDEKVNPLGLVPAVCVYSQRSPIRGIGISDVGDVADMQRGIYNELNEMYQLITLTNHPSLVKSAQTKASAGAGSIVQMPDDMNGDLKPYLLEPKGSGLEGLINSINLKVGAIDRMAHMGGIRSIETRRLSGVGLATEFQLLNARLAEKADNLEHAEEQIWRIYAQWQGTAWDGEVEYPDSFNIQDKYNDMNMLKLAKDAKPMGTTINRVIEEKMLRILSNDDVEYAMLKAEMDAEKMQPQATEEVMEHPITTPENRQSHIKEMVMEGLTDQQILDLHSEISQGDIDLAKQELINE
tara:strand:+ start:340 stop:1854 length:1515 start_codon:yes stop_codon:yes gene_type:complete